MLTNSNEPIVYQAVNYIDPEGSIVASADLLANATIGALHSGGMVTVDLAGLRAASSSYFNTLLGRLVSECGVETVRHRILFRFPTPAQQAIFDRSYQAVLSSFGAQV